MRKARRKNSLFTTLAEVLRLNPLPQHARGRDIGSQVNPATAQQEGPTRKRIEILNTKAYYLLVALSFLFVRGHVDTSLKVALTLTAAVAVLPVLDYAPEQALGYIRFFKVACLVAALGFTLYWLWAGNIAIVPGNTR
jgi:hypothetical protein